MDRQSGWKTKFLKVDTELCKPHTPLARSHRVIVPLSRCRKVRALPDDDPKGSKHRQKHTKNGEKIMERKTINSKKLGKLEFTTSGRYLVQNDRQCTDRDGNAITVDGDFLAVVKKYYASLIRQRKKLE